MIFSKIELEWNQLPALIFVCLILLFSNIPISAQPKLLEIQEDIVADDSYTGNYLSVTSTSLIQDLSFGTFCIGNTGGIITIPAEGSRSTTGDIILIPSSPGSPAILSVMVDNSSYITITTGSVVNLTNGSGNSMTLHINDFYPASPFVSTIGQNNIKIGGALTVGSRTSTPAGNYAGSFEVIFNEQ